MRFIAGEECGLVASAVVLMGPTGEKGQFMM